jgi:OmpA-OmpF porin, OOP family
MKKLAWSCIVAACLAGGSPLARAQDKNVLQDFYVGLGAGVTRAMFTEDDFASRVAGIDESKDSSDKGYKAVLGYRLDRHWAMELGRTNFGKFSHHYEGGGGTLDQTYKISGWWVGVLGILPIGNRFALFGRLGAFKSDASIESTTNSAALADALRSAGVPVDTATKTRKSTILGVGAQIDFPGAIGLRFEYEDYGEAGEQDLTGRARARMASASLMYRF